MSWIEKTSTAKPNHPGVLLWLLNWRFEHFRVCCDVECLFWRVSLDDCVSLSDSFSAQSEHCENLKNLHTSSSLEEISQGSITTKRTVRWLVSSSFVDWRQWGQKGNSLNYWWCDVMRRFIWLRLTWCFIFSIFSGRWTISVTCSWRDLFCCTRWAADFSDWCRLWTSRSFYICVDLPL